MAPTKILIFFSIQSNNITINIGQNRCGHGPQAPLASTLDLVPYNYKM